MTKDKKNYTYELRFIEMLFFPPLAICHIIFGKGFKEKRFSGIFLITWSFFQWLFFLSIESNMFTKIMTANVAIWLFFYLNLYVSVDLNDFSEADRMILKSFPIKLLVTVTCFFYMYSSPKMTHKAYAGIAGKSFIWTQQYIFISILFVSSWLAFMIIDNYETFTQFPKPEDKIGSRKLIPLSENITKLYGVYLFLIFTGLFYLHI